MQRSNQHAERGDAEAKSACMEDGMQRPNWHAQSRGCICRPLPTVGMVRLIYIFGRNPGPTPLRASESCPVPCLWPFSQLFVLIVLQIDVGSRNNMQPGAPAMTSANATLGGAYVRRRLDVVDSEGCPEGRMAVTSNYNKGSSIEKL